MALVRILIFISCFATYFTKTDCHCVSNERGEDTKNCAIEDYSGLCCKSLQFLIKTLTEQRKKLNITIYLETSTVLDNTLDIVGFEKLSMQGKNSTIHCDKTKKDTGVYIEDVREFELFSITIKNCGMLQRSSTFSYNKTSHFIMSKQVMCAVYILDSIDLTIKNVVISNNTGTGMVIYNTKGVVQILDSLFQNNKVSNSSLYSGGGGLVIEFTYCKLYHNDSKCDRSTVENSTYTIEDCNFKDNHAVEVGPLFPSYRNSYNSEGFGRGGGLFIALRGMPKVNVFSIHNCKFINNMASTWGGGMYLSIKDTATNNSIQISHSEYKKNTCCFNGGGGLIIVIGSYSEAFSYTRIVMMKCNFTENTALKQGGGLLIHSSRESKNFNRESLSRMNFTSCTWMLNNAALGSAVDISPSGWDIFGSGLLPTPKFTNCIFEKNNVNKIEKPIHQGILKVTERVGTLLVSRFAVELAGVVKFTDNNSNGIYLQSGTLTIHQNAKITFLNNRAKFGGGIALHAFSVIFISSHSMMLFENNKASIKGGAIYVDTKDQHEKISSRSCFIQRSYQEAEDFENATITFKGNSANSNRGNSIYASSFQPCITNSYCTVESSESLPETLSCVAAIYELHKNDMSTHLDDFHFVENEETKLNELIPGKPFKIPALAKNELNATIDAIYYASLKNSNSSIFLDESVASLSYVSNQSISIRALLSSNQSIFMTQTRVMKRDDNVLLLANNEITLSLNIAAIDCPPGHFHDPVSKECICDTSQFLGIWKCDREKKIASILSGYWIGYCHDGYQCTGYCPNGFCAKNKNNWTDLTGRTNESYKLICSSNREGKLCGKCTANHSVYYHSDSYRCGEESLCNYGILFYILSDIFPLTVIFIFIITFNISFTTGAVHGIIFYAQVVNVYVYREKLVLPQSFSVLFDLSEVVYTTTNLNYFNFEQLSFCLWKGAGTLDIIAWQYVSIVYALFIIIAVYIINTTNFKKLFKCCRLKAKNNAVVHSLTAFLVMCYSKCANVTFTLFISTSLHGYNHAIVERVVFFSGEILTLNKDHAKYYIPALFFMLLVVILPPILLIVYPLGFKVLALCKLSELKIVTWTANIIPMQLLDSLQSCFKDKFRFLSGLYFFYRAIPLLLYSVSFSYSRFYLYNGIFLILVLTIHATVQPYKNHWHNVTDTLLLANLAIINAISLYNYLLINERRENVSTIHSITAMIIIQIILVYLPLICTTFFALWFLLKRIKKKVKERRISRMDHHQETLLDSTYLPPLRQNNSVSEFIEYHQMK